MDERKEIPGELSFLEEVVRSRTIEWNKLPEHKEVISLDGNKRIVVEAGDFPMVRDFTVTLEGRISEEEFAPICRYEAMEMKQGKAVTEHSLTFFTLTNDGQLASIRYKGDGLRSMGGSVKHVKVSSAAGFNYQNWYTDVSYLPERIDFWADRDAFLHEAASGIFQKPAVVRGKSV